MNFRVCGKWFFFIGAAACAPAAGAAAFNYGEVLQKAIYFYECQQSGQLPSWNRVSWRGPSCIHDGKDVGRDLSGGWYDAGDHVKFHFPLAFSVTMLCWGVKEYRDAYVASGQLPFVLNNIRFAADFLMKCHTAPNEFWGQVGNGTLDHSFWGPAESVEAQMARPSAKIDATKPGTDLAGEAAAALAAASIIFKETDAAYSSQCLTHAQQLYSFADACRGKYDAAIPGVTDFYRSWSGYRDELVWGALWLYMATNTQSYLAKAESGYDSLSNEPQTAIKSYKWTLAWDNKAFACYCLLAVLTGKTNYKEDAQRWLDWWTIGVNGVRVRYTPGGLAWLDSWGSNRYAANTAFAAFFYSDHIEDAPLKARYHDFAVRQINYMLGDNPLKRSLVVGFGTNPPQRVHHRTASGMYPGHDSDTGACKHVLFGALVGGPDAADGYEDVRNNYTENEVACDYNAGFTGAIARMVKEFGGKPIDNFPSREPAAGQFHIDANVNVSGERFTEIRAILYNTTNAPARVCTHLAYRYYVDISEVLAAGYTPDQITITTNFVSGKPKVSPLTPFNGSPTVCFLEISYDGDPIYPGTQDSYRRETQFRLSLPKDAKAGSWDPSNDWSYSTVGPPGEPLVKATRMALFDSGALVWGQQPGPIQVESSGKHAPRESGPRILLARDRIRVVPAGRHLGTALRILSPAGRVLFTARGFGELSAPVSPLGSGLLVCEVEGDGGTRQCRSIISLYK